MTSQLPRRRFLTLTGGALLGGYVVGGLPAPAAAAPATPSAGGPPSAQPPPTIPSLQSWQPGHGRFVLTRDSRIVLSKRDAERLDGAADVFADDLRQAIGLRVPVVVQRRVEPGDGDIELVVDDGLADVGEEGYELRVGASVEVRGAATGVFFGTRTLLQWFLQSVKLPAGVARDWPRYPERGLLVSNAPLKMSMRFWQQQIRELSYLKMNMLWFVVGYPNAPVDDMRAVADFARHYHITVVPEFGMPSHMDYDLPGHPELQVPGRPTDLNIGKDIAYTWARDRLQGLVSTIPSPYWHTGADEFMAGADLDEWQRDFGQYATDHYGPDAIAWDTFNGFINFENKIVRAADRTMRMWNDTILQESAVTIDRNIVIEHWIHWGRPAADLLADGYQLQNSNIDFTYYDVGGPNQLDAVKIYEQFRVGQFNGSTVPDDHPGLRGSKLHVWASLAESEAQIASKLMAPQRSLSQVLWGAPKAEADYTGFAPLIQAIGRAPGVSALDFDASPIDGASSVPPWDAISVQFFAEMQPGSIKLALRASDGAAVAGTTTYDSTKRIAVFTPSAQLDWMSNYTATLLAASDSAGHSLTAPQSWSFRTAQQPHSGSPYSIWLDTDAPTEFTVDASEIELGVRLRSDIDGAVTGVRFYKAARTGGTHVASLWAADGTRLASATFTDESATGWQTVRFASPVAVKANTTYTASYHVDAFSRWAYTHGGYSNGKDSPPLHALHDGPDGANGVFHYGPSAFPTDGYLATNYWVDVVLEG